jgi:hypothetical protein
MLLHGANQLRCATQDQGETELPELVRQDIVTQHMAILAKGLAFHERQPPLAKSPGTIADLYDPEKIPANLRAAHDHNDEVLERIYIGRRFRNDTERLEKLFEM